MSPPHLEYDLFYDPSSSMYEYLPVVNYFNRSMLKYYYILGYRPSFYHYIYLPAVEYYVFWQH